MIPSEEEYLQAKNIVKLYENEQKRLYNIRALAFKEDFAKLWGSSNFQLIGTHIIPDGDGEWYEGELDDDIEEICKKHNVGFSIVPWFYAK